MYIKLVAFVTLGILFYAFKLLFWKGVLAFHQTVMELYAGQGESVTQNKPIHSLLPWLKESWWSVESTFTGLAQMEGQPEPFGQQSWPGPWPAWRPMQLRTRALPGPLKANNPPRSVITQHVGPFRLPSLALLSFQFPLCSYALIQAPHTLLRPKSLELCSIENKPSSIFISRGESSFHLPA